MDDFLYYDTVSDDFFWMILFYFRKTKEEVFSRFQDFKTHKESLTGKKI